MDLFNTQKVKELEVLVRLQGGEIDKLILAKDKARFELQICNEELDTLQAKLTEYEEAETKQLSFPSKKFNIKKGVELLTTQLSDKALAKTLHDLVEELGNSKFSHLVSLNNYVLSKLTRTKQ